MDVKEHLEALHKKALDRKVAELHRSTKTLFKFFEPIHFKLRDKFKWYYRWHASPLSTFTHWTVLLMFLVILIYSVILLNKTSADNDKIPQNDLLITGLEITGDKVAYGEEKSNVKTEKSRLILDDKKITIGFLRKKADLDGLVSWKDIKWSADVPQGTSIVYRIKTADEDKEETWDKITWSNYYPISGQGVSVSGIPSLKSRFIKIEVVLEGDGKNTPTLDYVRIGYTPFHENKVVAFLRDELISGLAKIFRFLEKRENSK